MITEFDNLKCDISFFDNILFTNKEISVEISFVVKDKKFNPYVEINREIARCKICIGGVLAYLFLEELPAVHANLITNTQDGSLIFNINNSSLKKSLSLDLLEDNHAIQSYAIVPSWGDVLIVFSIGDVFVEKLA